MRRETRVQLDHLRTRYDTFTIMNCYLTTCSRDAMPISGHHLINLLSATYRAEIVWNPSILQPFIWNWRVVEIPFNGTPCFRLRASNKVPLLYLMQT